MIPKTAERTAIPDAPPGLARVARAAGALYLPAFVLGPFALLYVRSALVVPDDAAATADRITARIGLLRAGTVIELFLALADVAVAALLYVLLRSVSRPLALVSSFLRSAWAVIAAIAVLTNVAALLVLHDASYLTALGADQIHATALLFLDLHEDALAIGFVAFGAHLAVLGYLLWISQPRALGAMLVIAGAAYILNSLLVLGWAARPQPLLLLPAFPAELALCMWLLVKGANAR